MMQQDVWKKIMSMNFVILLNARSYGISSGVLVYNYIYFRKMNYAYQKTPQKQEIDRDERNGGRDATFHQRLHIPAFCY